MTRAQEDVKRRQTCFSNHVSVLRHFMQWYTPVSLEALPEQVGGQTSMAKPPQRRLVTINVSGCGHLYASPLTPMDKRATTTDAALWHLL
mmetsp:Transcript_86555/g.171845  ORF Transcript_86555/g.171845 Transcript_86555/m.171845 type:complete len:90 (-) Transcript_86555:1655-1924(-)